MDPYCTQCEQRAPTQGQFCTECAVRLERHAYLAELHVEFDAQRDLML